MTARSSIDPSRLLEEHLDQASPDLLRQLLQTFINTLLSAEADAVCGAEYGTTTGRPRRCGWYDAVIARYAARVNGVTDFVLTKLDVLTGLEQVPVCVAYDVDGVRHDEMPVNQTDFHHAVPIYEYLPGWWEDISGARTLEDLPANARAYVQTLEEMSGARISAVGVGPPICRELQPPATSTSPFGRSVAVGFARNRLIFPAVTKLPVAGSKTSPSNKL